MNNIVYMALAFLGVIFWSLQNYGFRASLFEMIRDIVKKIKNRSRDKYNGV
jgi:hypothetical protein